MSLHLGTTPLRPHGYWSYKMTDCAELNQQPEIQVFPMSDTGVYKRTATDQMLFHPFVFPSLLRSP